MPRPLVVVFGANEAKAPELARAWGEALPALEIAAVTSSKEMLNALATRGGGPGRDRRRDRRVRVVGG